MAVLIEDLDAIVLTVGHVDISLGTADENIVRLLEIARLRAHASPLLDERSVWRVLHHAAAVRFVWRMPIRHEDVAIRRNRHAGRPIERVRSFPGTPGVPIVISTWPAGLILRTACPILAPCAFRAGMPRIVSSSLVSVVQMFPFLSTVNP